MDAHSASLVDGHSLVEAARGQAAAARVVVEAAHVDPMARQARRNATASHMEHEHLHARIRACSAGAEAHIHAIHMHVMCYDGQWVGPRVEQDAYTASCITLCLELMQCACRRTSAAGPMQYT